MPCIETPPVVLLTGASGGIGAACASKFAELGFDLVLTSRNEVKLATLENQLRQDYPNVKVLVHVADVSKESELKPIFQQLQKRFARLDALVHCAGNLYEAPLMMVKSDAIDQQYNIHVKTSILLAQYSSRLMARNRNKNKQLSLNFISSVVAEQGAPGQSVYGVSKAALSGLVTSLARELGELGIRVNAVSPGFIETDLVSHFSAEQRRQLSSKTALNRLGKPEYVAESIAFLASEKATYITGQTLAVDAGLTLN